MPLILVDWNMKRLIDFYISGVVLIVLSPFLMLVAFLVRAHLGSPILFRQTRIGVDNKPFEVLKFRSMLDVRDANGNLLSDKERLTPFGRTLRATSIDELPSLWNILKGEMSLVGPRPQDAKFIEKCSQHQNRRHEVRPGLTGWAQINGRNAITWEKRFDLDVWYVDNQSFALDCKIIFKTIPAVLLQRGVSAPGHVTMPAFQGNSDKVAAEAAE